MVLKDTGMEKNKFFAAETNGLHIQVEPQYLAEESNPSIGKLIFTYKVTIVNSGVHAVQLLSRYWHIQDGLLSDREVHGEGVIGQQPTIDPGDSFSYVSWCPLHSPIGKMSGHYIFKDLENETLFEGKIPDFLLIADYLLN